MKKLLVVLCAIAMICTMAVTASADAVGTAYTISYDGISIDIDIIDDFSSYAAEQTVVDDGQYTFDGEKLVWDVFAGGYNWGYATAPASPVKDIEGIEAAYNAATYTGFQVKNTGDADALIAMEDLGANPVQWATQMWVADGIKLVSADGVVAPATGELTYRGVGAIIPAGFDGWLFIPFTCMKIHCADEANGGSKVNFDAIFDLPSFCGSGISENEDAFAILEIDNVFLSSADLSAYDQPTGDVTETPSEVPSEDPTEVPTEDTSVAPTQEASVAPSESAAPQESGDNTLTIIIIAAVVVVIAAVVVIVIARKKGAKK